MSSIPQPHIELATIPEPTETVQKVEVPEDDEDDRVSVSQDVVSGPPEALDTDGLESKTKKELQELLTTRGIPFGKGDSKNVLISLLKATA